MKKLLITGGTVFVSRFCATWFVKKGYEVYVLNRNTRSQVAGVHLLCADRHQAKDILRSHSFDAVLDICAYHKEDIIDLLEAIPATHDYIFISSSAVYPQTLPQPFCETMPIGYNAIWQAYGMGKVEAEQALQERFPHAYILRPPYLYGPMQNVYREPFVFTCAMQKRPFYVPKDGSMPLQFFHVEDLCRCIEAILQLHPQEHIFNVGNKEIVDICTFVKLCYEVAKQPCQIKEVWNHPQQRDYFSFYDYAYVLDTHRQDKLIPDTKPLKEGLEESFLWWQQHPATVVKKIIFLLLSSILSRHKIIYSL